MAGEGKLHKVSTLDVDPDHRITGYLFFARIDGDFIAKETKHHLEYRSSLKEVTSGS